MNKHRPREERIPNPQTQGTGPPNAALSDATCGELDNRAREKGVPGRNGMSEAERVAALR